MADQSGQPKRRGPRPGGARPGGARPGGAGRPGKPGGQGQQRSPLEVAANSTANAMRRHADSIKDEQTKLACRAVLSGILGAGKASSSPAELLGFVEQVVHVLEQSGRRDDTQLPVTLRAVVSFSLENPRRAKDVGEMLRLALRHCYALAADHIPRQLRADGSFRASALADDLHSLAAVYLDDASFQKMGS